MPDPVVHKLHTAATYMLARFVSELATTDPDLLDAMQKASLAGHFTSVSIVTGGGTASIRLEMIDRVGARHSIASIDVGAKFPAGMPYGAH